MSLQAQGKPGQPAQLSQAALPGPLRHSADARLAVVMPDCRYTLRMPWR